MKIAVFIILLLLLFSCSAEQTKPAKKNYAETHSWHDDFNKDVVKVLEENKPLPEWVGKEPRVGCSKDSKKPVLHFSSIAISETSLEQAREAVMQFRTHSGADAIKYFVILQYQTILKIPEINNLKPKEYDKWLNDKLERLSFKQINTTELEKVDEYSMKYENQKNKIKYVFYYQFSIPYYPAYEQMRDSVYSRNYCSPCAGEAFLSNEKAHRFLTNLEEELGKSDKTTKNSCK